VIFLDGDFLAPLIRSERVRALREDIKLADVQRIENKILKVEGFAVKIRTPDRRDVRSDKTGLPSYQFERAANGDSTVADWKRLRFEPRYSGYEVEVLDGRGRRVPGNTKLSNVRETYERR